MSRALSNTFPMMQCGPRGAAHTFGVVRETGGAGRITSCEQECEDVNVFMLDV